MTRTASLAGSSSNCSSATASLVRPRRRQCRRDWRATRSAAARRRASSSSRARCTQFAAEIRETIDRERADPAAVGQDRQTLAGKARQITERFGGDEQFVEIERRTNRRDGTRRRRRRPIRPARRYGSSPPWRPGRSPGLTTSTGLARAAARAADMNLRASLTNSMSSKIARDAGSMAKRSSRSARSTSILSPMEATAENPDAATDAHSDRSGGNRAGLQTAQGPPIAASMRRSSH